MATTTNTPLEVSNGWVSVGGLVGPVVIQNDHKYREIEVCFGTAAVVDPVRGHTLKAGEKEWGIPGSQMWIRTATGAITVIITE
jgi:hypothetical protein